MEPRAVSCRLGIGTARGAEDDATDARLHAVLTGALQRGARLIDTAGNYRGGRSERVVGEAVRDACASGFVRRREVTLVTKGGYLRPAAGYTVPGSGMGDYASCHSISRDMLARQLDLSLRTLGLDYIDAYLLHNPEEQCEGRSQAEFDALLLDAFELLEGAVGRGEIRTYGIATWRGAESGRIGIARCKELAGRVAPGADHFAFVEAPLSLKMQASLAPTHILDGREMSLPRLCHQLGLSFIASAAAGSGSVRSLAAASVRWVMSLPWVATALVGTLNLEHIDEALGRPYLERSDHERPA